MTTNAWLAIIAVSSLVQLAIVLVLLIGAVRFQRRAELTLAEVKVDVRDAVERVRRADDAVRHVMQRAGEAAGAVVSVASRRVWPVLGLISAVRAGASALFGRDGSRATRRSGREVVSISTGAARSGALRNERSVS